MRLWAQRGKASVRGSAAGWTQVARLDHHSMRPWDGNWTQGPLGQAFMTPRAEEPKGRDRRPCLGMSQFLTQPLGKVCHLIRSSAHIPHFTDEKTEASKGKVTETLLLRSHLRLRLPLKRTLTPEGVQAFQGLSHANAPPHHLSLAYLTLQARHTP